MAHVRIVVREIPLYDIFDHHDQPSSWRCAILDDPHLNYYKFQTAKWPDRQKRGV